MIVVIGLAEVQHLKGPAHITRTSPSSPGDTIPGRKVRDEDILAAIVLCRVALLPFVNDEVGEVPGILISLNLKFFRLLIDFQLACWQECS